MADTARPPHLAAEEERPSGNTPARFIRTFAADMETVKAGKRPDLVPFADHAQETREPEVNEPTVIRSASLPSPSPSVSASPPPVAVPSLTPASEPKEPEPIDVLTPRARLIEGSVLPAELEPSAPVVPETPAPPPSPMSAGPSPIHTYRGDFSDHMRDTRASTATVLAAEQDANFAPFARKQSSRGNALYISLGIVLLILGGAGAYWGYARYASIHAPVILAPAVTAPIFVDTAQTVTGSGAALAQAIEQSVTTPLKDGTVRFLHFPASASTTESIFGALDLSTPGTLTRNLNAAGSMAGVVNVNGAQSPFFILSVDSYSETFAGMLAWEPKLLNALGALYPPFAEPTAQATSTATTTTASIATTTSTSTSAAQGFEDMTIDNHDVRAYLDAQGRTRIVYGYWDQHTLVIARDGAAFTEILDRLANTKK